MNHKKIRVLLLALIMSLSLSSCQGDNEDKDDGKTNENVQEEKVKGGDINIPITHVKALNPLLNASSSVFYFNQLVFEGLFSFDDHLEPKERLVETYKINPDRSIDLTLKKNISWHDGKKLNTSDVKFTIDTIKHGVVNARYAESISDMYKPEGVLDINKIRDVVVKDDYNMTIYFVEDCNNILEILTLPIISAQALEGNYERALEAEDYNPVGTGPYKQAAYEKLKFIRLEMAGNYWGEKPLIEKINGRILKDEDLSLTSFEAGQVDLSFSLGSEWEKYSQDEKVEINEFPSRKYEFLAVNAKSSVFEGEVGNSIKKAIAYGIDKEKIINRVYLGHATPSNTPVSSTSYLTNKEINDAYKYDVQKARDLLEKAGFKDTNNDTMYEDEDGNPITIKLSTNSYNELRTRTLEMISEDLKAIGINVEKDYEVLDTSGMTDEQKQLEWNRFESKINSGGFELALLGWETSFMQDIAFMFHSSNLIGTSNFINYENEELDSALDHIANSITKDEKKKNYLRAQKIIVEDLPYISLFFTNGAVLSNKKINGQIKPSYINIYTDIKEWFIPKKYQEESTIE